MKKKKMSIKNRLHVFPFFIISFPIFIFHFIFSFPIFIFHFIFSLQFSVFSVFQFFSYPFFSFPNRNSCSTFFISVYKNKKIEINKRECVRVYV